MGIQINGNTNNINAGIGSLSIEDINELAITGVSTFTGAIDANGDLDVDGHTNLDNVSIAGVTTITGTGTNGLLKVERASGAGLHIQAQSALGVFGTTSNHNLRLISNGNERILLSTNGNIGINDSSPDTRLSVTAASGTDVVGKFTSTDARAWIQLRDNSTTDTGVMLGAEGDDMLLRAGSDTRIRIESNGYVNIGTGTAQQQLTVQNSAQHSLIRVISNTSSDTGVDFGDTADGDIGRIRYSNAGDYMTFRVNNINAVRFDSSGRVQIGGGNTPAQVGDGSLIVYSTDRLHPAIKPAGMSNNYANGWTLLGDNYLADESQINLGLSYSSSSLVLSRGVKVSGSADNTYLSSQDSYAMRPCAIRMDDLGAFNFLTTETNATVATDSAVSLTEVFKIDRVGRIYQKISGRNMHFGAGNQLEIGVSTGGDPVINSAGGDLQIKDAGSNICIVRSDGFEMRKDIYFGTSGMGICLGTTSNTDANTLDDYEEGSWQPTWSPASGSIGYIARHGDYVKIGRTVHCMFAISANGSTSPTGELKITGLPFSATIPNANGPRGGGGVVFPGGGMSGDISKVVCSGTTMRIQMNDGSFLQTNNSSISYGYNAAQISGMFSFITAS